ncbi:hypothetical protein Asp14428_07670 [Actinoplanes sp. NBRC 14428]|nr:hypothetical protein Asp14428_07670 [Actinoplanes sp. NBRC 14428]
MFLPSDGDDRASDGDGRTAERVTGVTERRERSPLIVTSLLRARQQFGNPRFPPGTGALPDRTPRMAKSTEPNSGYRRKGAGKIVIPARRRSQRPAADAFTQSSSTATASRPARASRLAADAAR